MDTGLQNMAARYSTSPQMIGARRVVWCILLLELFFEYLIRPWDYNQAIESERAYQPATARYINNFHLLFESLALVLFIPEMPCLFHDNCGSDGSAMLSLQRAAMMAVTGSTKAEISRGHFVIGLAFLRMFALIRHWKQMWIRSMFDVDDERERGTSKSRPRGMNE